jgi:hypothetical protein
MMNLDSYDLLPIGPAQLRFVKDDGSFHREARNPGDDISDLPADVRQEIEAHWTPEIVAAFQAARLAVDEEFEQFAPPLNELVNAERQRRMVAGKVIDGVAVTGRDEDARNLTNLALGAQLRIAGGDLSTPTTFRDGNNVDHALTPPQVLSLWQQSAAYVSELYASSWAIKAMDPPPADITDDQYWS